MTNISRRKEQFIQAARQEAYKSPVLMRHGCVAVINGTIMASGHNNYRTYSKDQFINNTCTCHAEIATIRELYRNYYRNFNNKYKDTIKSQTLSITKMFKKTTLYIVRCNANGDYQDSAPCQDCFTVIKELNIKNLIYSSIDNTFKICKTTDYIPRQLSQGRKYLNEINSHNKSKVIQSKVIQSKVIQSKVIQSKITYSKI